MPLDCSASQAARTGSVQASGRLSRGALKALQRRSAVPVELDLRCERRLPKPVEVAMYYVVSEGWPTQPSARMRLS
jgi:hypothetical protein